MTTFTGPAVYTEESKFAKVDFKDIDKGKQSHPKKAKDGWIAIVQHYFVSAWLPKAGVEREYFTSKVGDNLYTRGRRRCRWARSRRARPRTVDVPVYIGPQETEKLEKVAPGLNLVVDYGWLYVIAAPLFWLLKWIHGVVGNWGWSIIILTIIIKLVFYPLNAKAGRSMAQMKVLAPKMEKLKQLYGEDRQKLNQAMMELYRTEKINPLGGCLPIVVQIPVFIALYWVLLASIELRHAPWLGWIQDLSAPDPYFILPVIYAISMFVQTKLNPQPADPVQAQVMLIMPIMFSVFFLFFPAGLVLYWVVPEPAVDPAAVAHQPHARSRSEGESPPLRPRRRDHRRDRHARRAAAGIGVVRVSGRARARDRRRPSPARVPAPRHATLAAFPRGRWRRRSTRASRSSSPRRIRIPARTCSSCRAMAGPS